MKTYKVLFFGSPDFALPSLKAIHEHPRLELLAVVTQPDRPAGRKMKLQPTAVKAAALDLGLQVFDPPSVNSPEVLEALASFRADAAVVVAFGQILSSRLLEIFPRGMVNVHGSLLPRWRGAAPIQRALMEGDQVSGVSLQRVVRKLDAGDVIAERRLPLSESVDAGELYQRLSVLGAELLTTEFLDFLDGRLGPQAQDESQVTVAPKIQKAEAEIVWSRTAEQIHNQVRGLSLGPQAWTYCGAKKLKILKTKVVAVDGRGVPGEVVAVSEESFLVQCGQSGLEVLEVQLESKAKMAVRDFLRGHQLQPGDRLGPEQKDCRP